MCKLAFESVCKSKDPFYCPQCRLDKQELEIKSLTNLVASLSGHVSLISDELASLKKLSSPASMQCSSYAAKVSIDLANADDVAGCPLPQQTNDATPGVKASVPYEERKFNVVIYGIDECPSGTARISRLESDLNQVVSIITPLVPTLNEQSVRDCVHEIREIQP